MLITFEIIIIFTLKCLCCEYYSPAIWNIVAQANRIAEIIEPYLLCNFTNIDRIEIYRFCVVVLILDRSSMEEHELCSSDKEIERLCSWTCFKPCLHSTFPWLKCNFSSDQFFCPLLLPNTIRHHLPARLLTFRLLVKFFWLVFTGTVNLCSVANAICFHNFWTHKSYGRFEQFLGRIWWSVGLTILRLLFLTFLSVPRGSHWYLKARQIPPPSTFFKIHQFDDIPFRVYVTCAVMWQRSGTLLSTYRSYPNACFGPMKPNPFHDLFVFQ